MDVEIVAWSVCAGGNHYTIEWSDGFIEILTIEEMNERNIQVEP